MIELIARRVRRKGAGWGSDKERQARAATEEPGHHDLFLPFPFCSSSKSPPQRRIHSLRNSLVYSYGPIVDLLLLMGYRWHRSRLQRWVRGEFQPPPSKSPLRCENGPTHITPTWTQNPNLLTALSSPCGGRALTILVGLPRSSSASPSSALQRAYSRSRERRLLLSGLPVIGVLRSWDPLLLTLSSYYYFSIRTPVTSLSLYRVEHLSGGGKAWAESSSFA